MRAAGSVLLCFPGAFNMTTGPAHWELLQRARALDNQVFVQPSDASLFSRGPSTFFRFCREFWSEMFALRLRGVEFPNPVCRRCAFLCVSARLFSTRGLDRHDSRPVAYLKPASPLHGISLPFRTVLRDNCISRTKPGLQVSGVGAQLRGRPVGHGRGDHGARQRDGPCRGRRRSGAGGPEGHPGVAPEEARLVQAGVAVNFFAWGTCEPFPVSFALICCSDSGAAESSHCSCVVEPSVSTFSGAGIWSWHCHRFLRFHAVRAGFNTCHHTRKGSCLYSCTFYP